MTTGIQRKYSKLENESESTYVVSTNKGIVLIGNRHACLQFIGSIGCTFTLCYLAYGPDCLCGLSE